MMTISPEYLIITLLRVIAGLVILRLPLLGVILSMLADYNDYSHLPTQTPEQMHTYQVWDKMIDSYYLTLAFYTSFSWEDTYAKMISIISYAWRIIGVVLFAFSGNISLLIFFPNLFENFFLFYLIFVILSGSQILFISTKRVFLVGLAVLLPKIVQEISLHFADQNLLKLLHLDVFPVIANLTEPMVIILQILLYASIPAVALVLLISQEWIMNRKEKY